MKFDFYFIHGWGFDKSFWNPVEKRILMDEESRVTNCIDLNLLSNKILVDEGFKSKGSNNIFVVHSYGLHWFLKQKINCKVLINFFGVPCFIKFQKKPNLVKKKINNMIDKLSYDPKRVVQDFYEKCNIVFENKADLNIDRLLASLLELKTMDYSKKFDDLNSKVFSIYSSNDRILNFDRKNVNLLTDKNKNVSFIEGFDHGFPNNEPELCHKIIKQIVKKI